MHRFKNRYNLYNIIIPRYWITKTKTTQKTHYILRYSGQLAFSAIDDISNSVHVYNINGANFGSKYVSGQVTGLTTAGEHLIVADNVGDITMSRLYGYVLNYLF